MRKITILTIAVAAVAFIAYAASDPPPTTLTKICTSIATPVQLGTGTMTAKTFVFMGFKGNRTTNTSTVWIQNSSANNQPGVPLSPGQIISFTSGKSFSIQDWWIDAETANDGVVVWVQDRP